MKRALQIFPLILMIAGGFNTWAQDRESILREGAEPRVFDKKVRWGLSLNQYWGNIKGTSLPVTYFVKPCLGFNLRAEYYPLSFLGIGAGFGFQQRGAGIINPDLSGGSFTHPWEYPQYDGDSTYRERLRFNTLEFPVTLLLRTPKDIVKGLRLSAAAGLSFVKTTKVTDIFMIVEDGYHQITDVSGDYLASDVAWQISAGPEIDAGTSCVFQLHFVYSKGTRNAFNSGSSDGRLGTIGFRAAWLF